jgi:ATP phosphoribosyltransferase
MKMLKKSLDGKKILKNLSQEEQKRLLAIKADREDKLWLGLPKGSLEQTTIELFGKAGWKVSSSSRQLFPEINDDYIQVMMLRAQEIAKTVERKVLDCGLTGRDWMVEQKAKVKEVCALTYSKTGFRKVKWVVAVPNDSQIKTVADLNNCNIATEAINITKSYLNKNKVKANVVFSWGATEAKAPILADAIVEVTETGRSLAANNLRILDTVFESETVFIANKEVYEKDAGRREKIDNIALMLQGAMAATSRVGLKMNVPGDSLKTVLKILPALHTPTLSQLADGSWYSLEIIVAEKKVRELIPLLKKAGASGIIEYPLNKLIY